MGKIVVLASGEDATKAKEALEGAGLDFEIVEPTAASLLHIALGMIDDDDEESSDEDAPDEEVPDEEVPSEEEEVPESIENVFVDGELVKAQFGNRPESALHIPNVELGPRVSYSLNESTFSFWPSSVEKPMNRVEVHHGSHKTSIEVVVESSKYPYPYFEVGADMADLFKTK